MVVTGLSVGRSILHIHWQGCLMWCLQTLRICYGRDSYFWLVVINNYFIGVVYELTFIKCTDAVFYLVVPLHARKCGVEYCKSYESLHIYLRWRCSTARLLSVHSLLQFPSLPQRCRTHYSGSQYIVVYWAVHTSGDLMLSLIHI